MPLINTIFKARYIQRLTDYILIEDLQDKTLYEMKIKEPFEYIEGEVLEIDVQGMHKNFELGRSDQLEGRIVNAIFDSNDSKQDVISIITLEDWKPVSQYGEKAANFFFPFHKDEKYFYYDLEYALKSDDVETVSAAYDKLDSPDEQEVRSAIREMSKWINASRNYLFGHVLMASVHQMLNEPVLTKKYAKIAVELFEQVFEKLSKPFIFYTHSLPAQDYLKMIYLSEAIENSGKPELSALKKVYQIDPFDDLRIRSILQAETGEEYPMATGEDANKPINPYAYAFDLGIPLHDAYEPDSKQNAKKWKYFDSIYKFVLIARSHEAFFKKNGITKSEDIKAHVTLHILVEDIIANENPLELRQEMSNLFIKGYSRHDVIHEIGSRLTQAWVENQKSHHNHEHCDHDHHDHNRSHEPNPLHPTEQDKNQEHP